MFQYRKLCVLAVCCAIMGGCQGSMYGAGPVTLSKGCVAAFEKYTRQASPYYFALSLDGNHCGYSYCTGSDCLSSGQITSALKACRKAALTECKIYAEGRRIAWDINAPALAKRRVVPTFLTDPDDGRWIYCLSTTTNKIYSGGTKTACRDGDRNITHAEFVRRYKTPTTAPTSDGSGNDLVRCMNSQGITRSAIGKCDPNETLVSEAEYIERTKAKRAASNTPREPTKSKTLQSSYKTTRPIAVDWEGYHSLLIGTVDLQENGSTGTMKVALPEDAGDCTGSYNLGTGLTGIWAVACTNNLAASGTLQGLGRGKGSTGVGTDTKGRKVRFTLGGEG